MEIESKRLDQNSKVRFSEIYKTKVKNLPPPPPLLFLLLCLPSPFITFTALTCPPSPSSIKYTVSHRFPLSGRFSCCRSPPLLFTLVHLWNADGPEFKIKSLSTSFLKKIITFTALFFLQHYKTFNSAELCHPLLWCDVGPTRPELDKPRVCSGDAQSRGCSER